MDRLKNEVIFLNSNKKALNLKRREIYQCITKYPGLHFRELSRKLRISTSTLNYHLNYLKKRGLIIERSDDRFIRYYPKNKIGEKYKKVLNLLRQETPKKIMIFIIAGPDRNLISISKELKKDPRTIAFHLKKLIKIGLIEPISHGREVKYRLKDWDIMNDIWIITYQDKIFDGEFTPLIDFLYKEKFVSNIDKVIKTAYEIFPHPYHV